MIRVRDSLLARRRMAGLSLIEMMIALVMALIVAAGIITVFQSTSSSNRVQAQLATLQEEGRFAIHSLRDDLANANGAYCSNTGGNASLTGSGLYIDALRSPTVFAKADLSDASVTGHFPDNTVNLPDPTQAYSLPSSLFMRGYDCGTTSASCKPVDPSSGATGIPAMGKLAGDRVPGASVLTIRYLKPGSGWALGIAGGSTMDTTAGTITLDPLTGEDPAADFTGNLALLASCSNAQVYSVTSSSGVVTFTGDNYAQPQDISNDQAAAPRVFDFNHDFQTVTYDLEVVDAGNGHTTGALVRRVNGKVDVPGAGELVRGVERLDFLYGILDADGNTEFLTAEQVDEAKDAAGTPIPCPPGVSTPGGMPTTGCLWRAVQTVQVNILMDGQTPLYTLAPAEMNYIYSPDGDNTPAAPDTHDIKPDADQGFPKQLLRREFTTVIALRNYNP